VAISAAVLAERSAAKTDRNCVDVEVGPLAAVGLRERTGLQCREELAGEALEDVDVALARLQRERVEVDQRLDVRDLGGG
jgi:hypothetical protein